MDRFGRQKKFASIGSGKGDYIDNGNGDIGLPCETLCSQYQNNCYSGNYSGFTNCPCDCCFIQHISGGGFGQTTTCNCAPCSYQYSSCMAACTRGPDVDIDDAPGFGITPWRKGGKIKRSKRR